MCPALTPRGYWCDAVDPRTGHALHGAAGCGFDEVIGAQVLLGYDRQQQQQQQKGGGCPLVSHPLAGTQVRPSSATRERGNVALSFTEHCWS